MKNWFVCLLAVSLVACGGETPNTTPASSDAKPAEQPTEVVKTTADELLKTYKENEVAGNQKYKGKTLEISAKIASIETGLADVPYLVLKAGGEMEFNQPQAHFDKAQTEQLAKLKKGQAITLQCVSDGEMGGTPMLKDCVVKK